VLVVVDVGKARLLSGALGADASRVAFEDAHEVAANPARLIPAMQDFLDEHAGAGGSARAVGETLWPGRREEEMAECQLHEALINRAFAGADESSLLCAYDAAALPAPVLQEACASHPLVATGDRMRENPAFRGTDAPPPTAQVPLPPPPPAARVLSFDGRALEDVREAAGTCAVAAGLDDVAVNDLVLVAHELAVNSVRHGGGFGVLRAWTEDTTAVCEVRDAGRIDDPLAGRRRPARDQAGGWGLWLANQLCDLVHVRSGPGGTVVRVRRSDR
jgi:anti-sigma regulatory factor (Ser/Thr protein kinase)